MEDLKTIKDRTAWIKAQDCLPLLNKCRDILDTARYTDDISAEMDIKLSRLQTTLYGMLDQF